MAGADLRLADDPSADLGHGDAAEHRVRVLLVLVAELDALRAAVQLRAREPDREVAPVVGRERAGQVMRARSDGGAAGGDHRRPRLQDPPVARRRSGLDEHDRVGCVLPEQLGGSSDVGELAEHVRDDDELGRARRRRDVAGQPAGIRQQLPARRDHLGLDLDERQFLERRPCLARRPRGHARPGADIEQRPWLPVRSLQRDLPEDRGRRRVRRRRAVGEVGGDLGAGLRRSRPIVAAICR